MKYFKFKETVTLWGTEYKKGQELEIREDDGVWDTDGSWLFDYDSRNAEKYGFVVNK